MKRGKFKPSALDELYEAILCLETKEECSAFFDDLCTVLELQTISQRLQVAKMLRDHHVYSDIVSATGASTATISRVNRSLNYQSKNGYDIVFNRLREKNGDAAVHTENAGAEAEE
ncbi:MAG: TrpR-like protein, YerC/YecD [Oscillospiraceae bacterium]|nr:TrpR-like protein, YerC/YecD [Oscillospiraceae bacterium]MBQ7014467.1 TrpR-like protein, YerC/YecD [Oscillospiraceae bacterium]